MQPCPGGRAWVCRSSEEDSIGIRCEEARKAISDYIDENLDAVHRSALNQHLAQCRHCTAVLDGMRNLIGLYRDERVFVLPDGFHERLEQKLKAWTTDRETPRL